MRRSGCRSTSATPPWSGPIPNGSQPTSASSWTTSGSGWARTSAWRFPPSGQPSAASRRAGELALALGVRHPDLYGVVLCASPGGGYQPPPVLSDSLPRVYLVVGTREPFFRKNASRWADALRAAGGDVTMTVRDGSHGDAFWREELPLMVAWAFAS